MKFIKYLALSLCAGLFMSSCEKQEVEYPWSNANGVQYQIWNIFPNSKNLQYAIVNGNDMSNMHGTFIAKNNFTPSGSANLFYQTTPGNVEIVLGTENASGKDENGETKYERTEVYKQTVQLEDKKQYQLFVYDYNQAPSIVEYEEAPNWDTYDSLGDGNHAAVKIINLMFEDKDTPANVKYVQAWIKDKQGGNVIYKSKPTEFGKTSEWIDIALKKSSFLSNGYQKVYYDLHETTADGTDLGVLKYYNAKGTEKEFVDDYWTLYYGRATYWVLQGTRDASSSEVAVSSFSAR